MKVKIGQWVRLNNNQIKQITALGGYKYFFIKGDAIPRKIENFKITDTPQELIEDNDLFFIRGWNYPIISFRNIDDDIVKILTPIGKDYICQWESK